MSEKITARMKWIVKQLKDHEGAVITNRRDWFMEKSFYTLDWTDGEGYHCVEVTDKMRKQLSEIDRIMNLVPEECRKWCDAQVCACVGCVNISEQTNFEEQGVEPPTRKEFEMWVKHNEFEPPK